MHWPERGQIYFYASSPDAAAWMLKLVFVYLANTAVLCYSLTIICCCQVQDYIYWIISTENDYRHHHKFIKYEKRLRKEGKTCSAYLSSRIFATSARVWTHSTSFEFVPTVQLIPYIYPAFVPFGRYFTSIHISLWICQSSLSSTPWHFLFCPRTTCCLLFLNSVHAQDGFT
jgi:hypothetical protein